MRKFLRSKIHRATVTKADVDYEGSVAIDLQLMRMAGIAAYEAVHVWDITNGERLMTYAIPSPTKGEVCINGAAAKKINKGDVVIIATFIYVQAETSYPGPTIIKVDADNNYTM